MDMLVKLYDLPTLDQVEMQKMKDSGLHIRRALAPEKHVLVPWVNQHFNPHWASEVEVCFANHPVSCFLAFQGEKLLGFAAYEATCLNFLGPMGVLESARGLKLGKLLLLHALHALREKGYAYAIIGGVGPQEFYHKVAGASPIQGSSPGIYKGMMRSILSD